MAAGWAEEEAKATASDSEDGLDSDCDEETQWNDDDRVMSSDSDTD